MENRGGSVVFPILFPSLWVILFALQGARSKWGGTALTGASQQTFIAGVAWVVMRLANAWLFKEPWTDWETISGSVASCWARVGGLTGLALWIHRKPKAE